MSCDGNIHGRAVSPTTMALNCSSKYDLLRLNGDYQTLVTLSCVVLLYMSAIVIVGGLIGNVLCFVTLGKDRANTTSFLLRALAICDGIVLTLGVFPNVYQGAIKCYYLEETGQNQAYVFSAGYTLGMIRMAQTVSSWIVVTVAFDRFIKVCFVAKAPLFTVTRMKIVLGVISISSIIAYLPVFFERTHMREVDPCTGAVYVLAKHTQFASSLSYSIGYSLVFQGLIRLIIPVSILVFLNTRLIIQLRRTMAVHRKIAGKSSFVSSKRESGRTRVLVAVITVFIFSQTLFVIVSTLLILQKVARLRSVSQQLIDILIIFNNFALLLNSATNIIIYVLLSSRFRSMMCRIRRPTRRITVANISSSNHM